MNTLFNFFIIGILSLAGGSFAVEQWNTLPKDDEKAMAMMPIVIFGDTDLCSGDSTTLTAFGAAQYLWSTGETTAAITVAPTSEGYHTYSVSDPTGAADPASVNVFVQYEALLFIAPQIDTTICLGDSLYSLTATNSYGNGSVQYLWQESMDGNIWNDIPGAVSPNFNVPTDALGTNFYRVSGILNGMTCSSYSSDVEITVIQSSTISIAGDLDICMGESTTLTASGGSSYLWSTGETGNSITFTPPYPGGFQITVSDPTDECAQPAEIILDVSPVIPLSIDGPNSTCAGFNVVLSANGPGPYLWSTGQTAQSILFSTSVTGDTSIILSNPNNECFTPDTLVLSVGDTAGPTITGDNFICGGDSTVLTASGISAYLWNTGATDSVITVMPTNASEDYWVSDPTNNCASSATFTVFTQFIDVEITPTNDVTVCENEPYTLTVSNPWQCSCDYTWESNDGTGWTPISGAMAPTFTMPNDMLGSTSYRAKGQDVISNCFDYSNEVNITVSPLSALQISGDSISCDGASITLTASGGNSYLWNTGETTQSISYIPISNFTFIVQDPTNSCSTPDTFTVYSQIIDVEITPTNDVTVCENEPYTLTVTDPWQCSCDYTWESNDGTGWIPIPGAIAPTYTTPNDILGSTSYRAKGQDIFGDCFDYSNEVNITVSTPSPLQITGDSISCYGDNIILTASGGSSYLWNTGETTQSITYHPNGDSTFIVQDPTNPCLIPDTFNIYEWDYVDVDLNETYFEFCQGEIETVSIINNSGEAYSYQWQVYDDNIGDYVDILGEVNDSLNIPNLVMGYYEYQVLVYGAPPFDLCYDYYSFQVEVYPVYDIMVSGDSTICLGESTVLTASGGTDYYWSTDEYDPSITVSPIVTTTYTVFDDSGYDCSDSVNYTLTVLQPSIVNLVESICDGENYLVGSSVYTTSGTYQDVLTTVNGCDSIVNLNLTVNPVFTTNLTEEICDGENYIVGSSVYTASGIYQDTLATVNGCDSIVNLDLTVNPFFTTNLIEEICDGENYLVGTSVYTASGIYQDVLTTVNGCDSIVNLNLTVNPVFTTNLIEEICDGENYLVGSSVYTTSGIYQDVLTTVNGCDSIVNLNLTVNPVFTTNLTEEICDGENYLVGTSVYTASGIYQDVLTTVNGCDSIVNLNLAVNPVFTTNLIEEICDGENYLVGTSVYTASGIYQDVLTTVNGCDSIVNLNLTVHPVFTTNLTEEICDGENFLVGTSVYTASGIYQDVLTTVNGCDSIVNLNLTVNPVFTTNLTEEICDGENYLVGSSMYTASGIYQDVLTTVNGCDSIVNLNLTVNPVFTTNLIEEICDGENYLVGTSVYTTSGIYQDVLTTINGCDSIVNLNLTVNPVFTTSLIEEICDGENYQVGTSVYTASGIYQDVLTTINGCDSIVNLNLTVHPVFTTNLIEEICDGENYLVGSSVYTASGIYQDVLTTINSCDSIVNLNLTVNPVFTTNLIEEICDGENYLVGTSVYTASGIYQDVLTTVNGCDSIVNLNLTVNPVFTTNLTEEICDGENYLVGTSVYTASGIYQDVLTTVNGCDSIVNLNLTVNPVFTTNLIEEICDGESFIVGTSFYTSTGIYQDILTTVNGCDSIVNLDLTVNPIFTTNLTEEICDGDNFVVGTSTYTTTGVYQDSLTTINGCDSVVNMSLTVHPVFQVNLAEEICDGEIFTVGNSNYTISGNYTDSLLSINGCDSIVNLNLVVHPILITELSIEICDGETFSVGNSTYAQSGMYTDILIDQFGCDSIVNLDLKVNLNYVIDLSEEICNGETFTVGNSIYNSTGSYADLLTSSSGCDSLVNLTLVVLPVYNLQLQESICDGEIFTVGNTNYNTAGNYIDTLVTIDGCDSIVNLNLAILETNLVQLNEVICDNTTFTVGNNIYSETGFYTNTLSNAAGCDSLVELNLTVLGPNVEYVSENICEGDAYILGNDVYYETGSYAGQFVDQMGCDSFVVVDLLVSPMIQENIAVNTCGGDGYIYNGVVYTQPGTYEINLPNLDGCDTLVTLNLFFDNNITTELIEEICEGENYLFGNDLLTSPGMYSQTLMTQFGCDSTVNLTLVALEVSEENIFAEICEGDSYSVGASSFSESGIYSITLSNQFGCDSTINLNLTVGLATTTALEIDICEGETYTVGTITYSEAGSYTETLTTSIGCDSIVNLELNIFNIDSSDVQASICSGDTYTINATDYSEPGQYQITLSSIQGCDSIVNLDLEVLSTFEVNETASICQGDTYLLGNSSYGSTGNYTEVLSSSSGCDSTINLSLTVFDSYDLNINETLCQGEVFTTANGTYTSAGTYTESLTSIDGCDSIVNININVLPIFETNLNEEICEGEFIVVGSQAFNTSGTYSTTLTAMNGCDSVIDLTLNVLPSIEILLIEEICEGESFSVGSSTYTETGMYSEVFTNLNGCDSIVNLQLTVFDVDTENITASICQGESYIIGGTDYSQSGFYQGTVDLGGDCVANYNLTLTVFQSYDLSFTEDLCANETLVFGTLNIGEPGTYTQTFNSQSGCDSTVTLFINEIPVHEETIAASICDGETYEIAGQNFDSSGSYTITSTASTGCDSIITLLLTVDQNIEVNVNQQICAGDSIIIDAQSYNETGFYEIQLTTNTGCDSIIALDLVVLDLLQTNLTENICPGSEYIFDGQVLTNEGTYSATYESSGGCDSLVTLELSFQDNLEENVSASICSGDNYSIGSESFTQAGTYEVMLFSATGCDSLVILDLEVNSIVEENISAEICAGESYELGTSSFSEAGTYEVMLTASNGCDSIVNLDLSVSAAIEENISAEICTGTSYSIGAMSFDQSGNYSVTLTAAAGCDSIVNLDLTVANVLEENLTEQICTGDEFTVGTMTFDQSGSYEVMLTATAGCDSIVNLNLTVSNEVFENVIADICSGETYSVGDSSFAQTGNYEVMLTAAAGCDSIVNLELTVADVIEENISAEICGGDIFMVGNTAFDQSGIYEVSLTASSGCDSIVNLDLFVNDALAVPMVTETLPLAGCGVEDGIILITPQTAGEFIFSIDGGITWQSDPEFQNLGTGTYEVLMASADTACSVSYQEIIEFDIQEAISFDPTLGTIDCDNMLIVTLNAQGGTGDFLYTSDGGANWQSNPDFNITAPANVTFGVSNADGSCETFGNQLEIEADAFVEIENTLLQSPLCVGEANGSITLEIANPGAVLFEITWAGGETGTTINNISAGTYTATLTNIFNGCSQEITVELEEPELFTVELAESSDTTFCQDSAVITAGPEDWTYAWSFNGQPFSDANEVTVTEAGNYLAEVISSEGCEAEGEVDVFFSDTDFNADFLIPFEGLVGQSIVAADISWPIPQSISWSYNADSVELEQMVENHEVLSFLYPGSYTVSMTATFEDCIQTISKDITIVNDINELSNPDALTGNGLLIADILLFPNPNDGQFTVRVSMINEGPATLGIYNELGSLIEERALDAAWLHEESYTLNVGPGVYGLVVRSGWDWRFVSFVVD